MMKWRLAEVTEVVTRLDPKPVYHLLVYSGFLRVILNMSYMKNKTTQTQKPQTGNLTHICAIAASFLKQNPPSLCVMYPDHPPFH